MEIKFGIENTPHEVTVDVKSGSTEVMDLISTAIENSTIIKLEDRKGNKVLIPGAKVAYVELVADASRPVGFGAL